MSSLFVITLLLLAVGILIFLLAKLLRSYPIVFVGLITLIITSVMAFADKRAILGIMWLVMGFATAVAGAIYWYKNVKGAFWWSFGALLAMVAAAAMAAMGQSDMLQLVVTAGVFAGIGLIGSLLFPRLIHKKKEERNHITNVDVLIGKRLRIIKEAEGDLPQRGLLGDVDWSVKPAYNYESFKVGDVVKVISVKGVTLLCVRDGKDQRKELKEKHKADSEAARVRAEERRKEREAKKAEKAKQKEEAEAAKKAAEAEKAKEEPKVEEPAPVVEEPKKEEPVKEEPKVEEPAPVVEEPKKEEPAPVVEEPKKEEPAPVVEEPKKEEPAPVVEEPAPAKKAKPEFIPFGVRLAQADPFVRDAYNELKAEVLSYGIKSRISSTGDTFRLHTKTYVKMVVAGKYLKLYLALNPEDYKDTTYPFEDASKMGAHVDAPFVFKIKSGLSVRRAKVLIGDAAKKDELAQGEVVAHNYASEVEAE